MIGTLTHHHYHLSRLGDAPRLLWTNSMRSIGYNLVALFVPIYLYRLGFSMPIVMLYLAGIGAAWLGLVNPAMALIAKLGVAKGIVISLIASIIELVLLLVVPHHHWLIILIALAGGAYNAFYWPAFRLAFAHSLAHRRTGRYVSVWSASSTVAAAIAPGIGGLAATLFGIGAIYVVAIGFLVLAVVPLFTSVDLVTLPPFELNWSQIRRHGRDVFANLCELLNDASINVVWPFLIFFIVPTYAAVGLLSSVTVISSILIALYVGQKEEQKGVRHYVRQGAGVSTISHVFRLIVQTTGQVFGVNLVSGAGYALYLTPFNTRYYERIETGKWSYLWGMQAISALGWMILFLILAPLALILSPQHVLLVGIVLAIPFTLGISRMY